ncbi:hypothetical protein G3N55_04145 [Dissulfurirhabdus thermomarina]|uniref:Cytochrome c7-like domain-containing protein n=1 Tax=Dissulfurirhabdus thermomarina TaxID=1765737 RepID=A0A6N9TLP1_DISTH|nr:c(7)-type cytochrome triheme domain-containing protein [Dissulfurirhabdus thermomarina]NDY42039.1 hypothetical protein [Dissulfurirhabdus thermomarina]NMX22331.1 hypothetical protein [Dissulfurirhabdus thermomarina]
MKKVLCIGVAALVAGLVLHFGPAGFAEEEQEHGGDIIFTKPVKAVLFSHQTHIDQGLECDSCHDDPFEMAAGTAEENGDFTMEALYQGKYCGTCHDGETAFASNTRCAVCHIGVKGYNRLYKLSGEEGEGGHGE